MRQKISDADVFPRFGRRGQIFRDFFVQIYFAFFDQKHNRGGGNLLGNRADFKDGFFRHGHAEFDARQPVACGFYHATVFDNGNRRAGNMAFGKLRVDVFINLVGANADCEKRKNKDEK